MWTLNRNKQNMYYALPGKVVPVYETDDEGNIRYVEVDGELIPIKTGAVKTVYSEPIPFRSGIYSQLKDGIMRAYGADKSNNYAIIVIGKEEKDSEGNPIKFVNGTVIWRESAIKYDKDGNIEESSADYRIDGVMTEELNETSYYLQVLNGAENEN